MLNVFVPASGSVTAKHMRDSPVTVGVTRERICSGVPWRMIVSRANTVRM